MALFAEVDAEPAWLDRARVAEGADAMTRQGAEGLCALSGVSLMGGYLSTNAIKPLVATGALTRMAPRRLAETTQFVHSVATSGDMPRFSSGFTTAVRVRVMHALVRAQLASSPDWDSARWGVPINQRTMVLTHLSFTVLFIAGVSALGRVVTPRERDAIMHLWRYVSFLLGTPDRLLPHTFREAVGLGALLNFTEAGPDADSQVLARALMAAWGYGSERPDQPLQQRLFGSFMVGYSRYALGAEVADRLGIPSTPWRLLPPALAGVRLLNELVDLSSRARRQGAVARGRRLIDRHLSLTMGGKPASFIPRGEPGVPAMAP